MAKNQEGPYIPPVYLGTNAEANLRRMACDLSKFTFGLDNIAWRYGRGSAPTIKRAIMRGDLPACKIDGKWAFCELVHHLYHAEESDPPIYDYHGREVPLSLRGR